MTVNTAPWRDRALQRALSALDHADSPADRGALLREACRLSGGALSGIGLRPGDCEVLERFGLQVAAAGEHGHRLFLLDDEPEDELDRSLATALRLDDSLRQPYETATPDAALLRLSGHARYRTPTQKAALRALLTMPPGATLLATMPTGAGKSLLFQIAPRWFQEQAQTGEQACIVVVVPTVALALAHLDSLAGIAGLGNCRALTSRDDSAAREATLNAFRRGEVPILILSPEMALGGAREALLEAAKPPDRKPPGLAARLAALVIDEAHIVESWGRTFRPDFQRLPALARAARDANPELRTVLLSATVADSARGELMRAYGGGDLLAVDARVPRYEFDLVTARFPDGRVRQDRLIELIDRLPRPALIYTSTVKDAETIHRRLHDERRFRRLALFTGELDDTEERLRIVKDWRTGHLDLVVATSAFGMGIDKDDVRVVVHACIPETASRYYQEIGRAARDGHQGLALLLWTEGPPRDSDWDIAAGQARKDWLTLDLMQRRWRAILDRAQRENRCTLTPNGTLRLPVPLDARHDGLGPDSTDYNRLWNMSLLNLLQRAGLLVVRTVEGQRDETPIWHTEIIDARLLADPPDAALWDEAAAHRAREREQAESDFRRLQKLLRSDETCLLAGMFELVETGEPLVQPCGRCPFCRRHGLTPPDRLEFGGLDTVWQQGQTPAVLGAGIAVLQPRDFTLSDPERLLHRLTSLGFEQMVVPDGMAALAATALRSQEARYGFVLEHRDVLGDWHPANLPTAILIRPGDPAPALTERIRRWSRSWPDQTFLAVAGDGVMLDRRPLPHVLSPRAPLSEDSLPSSHAPAATETFP